MILEKRKAFWVLLLLAALASAIASFWLLPKALPLLQVQMSMSRDQALTAAETLQAQRFAELRTTRAAVQFEHDQQLQNYVELEGGGVDAYTALLGQRFIAPYHWTVRRFAESQEDELSVRFTPDGHPYGFTRKVPEKAPGAALDETRARALAEAGARSLLGDALWTAYAQQSASQVTRPGGRIDHTFVYEHVSEKRAEARFRVKLVVAGDRLVEVTPHAFVPQAFVQRFTEMRTANDAISQTATIAMIVLFALGGVLGGWIWLSRRRALAWRSALTSGAVVGGLVGAALLSSLPLRWFGYTTTDSASSFLLLHCTLSVGGAVVMALLLGLLFAVAEGLSRHAFAAHPRLFSLWSVAAGASPQAWGRTLGGYAWMCLELSLVAGFYLVVRQQFGWWVPTESLSDPNILSAWRPALAPIALALQAGTWEEALFRAVPLAGAALIGQKLGWRRSAIAVALVLQALVFAGAHAGYPGLPGYSRLVELSVPALIWGLIFLRYGLVPCMIMHFTFDLVLFSQPLFVVNDPALWVDRVLVVLAGLTPVLMVLRARLKQGRFADLPEALRNGQSTVATAAAPAAVLPETAATPTPVTATPEPSSSTPSSSGAQPWWLRPAPLVAAAMLGTVALGLWQTPRVDTPVFTVDHGSAIARAEAVLAQRGVRLNDDWKRLAIVRAASAGDNQTVNFVWREAGPQVFRQLLGKTLLPQHWQVKFKRAAGPVEERSESWEVLLTGQGELLAVGHELPEGRAGAKLDRAQALERVRQYISSRTDLTGRPWELASVQEQERPARRDWVVNWDDKQVLNVKGSASRLNVIVRGDEIAAAWQYVFVPEAWQRERAQAESAKIPFKAVAGVTGVGLVLFGLILALRQVVQGTLRWRQGLTWAGLLLAGTLANYALTFDHKAMSFNVAQDWATQWATHVGMAVAGNLVMVTLLALLVMRLHGSRSAQDEVARDMARGLGLALVLQGVQATLKYFLPPNAPSLPGVGAWDSTAPMWSTVLGGPGNLATAAATVALVAAAAHFARTRSRTAVLGALVAIVTVGAILAAETLAAGISQSLPVLLGILVLWALLRRGETGVALATVALTPLANLPQLLATPIANADTHAALACATALVLTWWALRYGRSLGHASGP